MWRDLRCSSRVQTGISGNFLSCLKGVRYPFKAQEGRWDFSRVAIAEKGLSLPEGRISLFFSSCGGDPHELQCGPE